MHVKVASTANETNDFVMPLEFKTGKATNGQVYLCSIDLIFQIYQTIFTESLLYCHDAGSHGTQRPSEVVHPPYV